MLDGKPFCEFLTFDNRRLVFRTLGNSVPARLNYVLDGKRVAYRTFRSLFKANMIKPGKYKGDNDPGDGITQFYLTELGYKTLVGNKC